MPAYFSITLQWLKSTSWSEIADSTYAAVTSSGFGFKGGYQHYEEKSLAEIALLNQEQIDKSTEQLKNTVGVEEYIQVLFESTAYEEVRGFWFRHSDEINFVLIVPEANVLEQESAFIFLAQKLNPLLQLSIDIWKSTTVETIQTALEYDEVCPDVLSVLTGNNIMCRPFSIVPSSCLGNFKLEMTRNWSTVCLEREGVALIDESSIISQEDPPDTLDSAEVLFWAWSGKEPFWVMNDSDGSFCSEIYGLAICKYKEEDKFYRFVCSRTWTVQNDTVYDSLEEIFETTRVQSPKSEVKWHKKIFT